MRGGISKLLMNVKSHKCAGEVGARLIHSATFHPLAGLGRWIAFHLKPFLNSLQHLAKNSQQVRQSLSAITVDPEDILLKFDIKEYYFSGAHEDIVRSAKGHVGDTSRRFQDTVGDAVLATLHWQYVQTPSNQIFNSGMFTKSQDAAAGIP